MDRTGRPVAEGGETKPEVTPGDKSSNTSSGMTGPRPAEGAEMEAFAGEDVATGNALTDEAFAGEDVATGDALTGGTEGAEAWKPGGTEGSEDLGFRPSLSLKTENSSSLYLAGLQDDQLNSCNLCSPLAYEPTLSSSVDLEGRELIGTGPLNFSDRDFSSPWFL